MRKPPVEEGGRGREERERGGEGCDRGRWPAREEKAARRGGERERAGRGGGEREWRGERGRAVGSRVRVEYDGGGGCGGSTGELRERARRDEERECHSAKQKEAAGVWMAVC